MKSSYEEIQRYAIDVRQRKQDELKQKATFEHRRIYAIGQMTIEELHDVPKFALERDGTRVIPISYYEDYVKALSDRTSSHIFLSSISPPSKAVVKALKQDMRVLARSSKSFVRVVAPFERVVSREDQISKYTDDRHLLQRQKYLVGKIMLNYFPELPPLTGGTNDEYRHKLARYKQLLNLINTSKMEMVRATLRTVIERMKLQ